MTLGGPDVADTYWSEHRRAIAEVLGSAGVKLMDATIASVEADGTVTLFIEGRPATPKSYPVIASGLPPRPGDVVWALRVSGGYVVLGRNAHPADKSVAGAIADARTYTDDRIKRYLTTNQFAAGDPPSAWDPGNLGNAKYYVMIGGTTGGWPGSGTVITEMPAAVPAGSTNAGFVAQRWAQFNGNRTLWRSGTNADGWTAWQEYSPIGHTHDWGGWTSFGVGGDAWGENSVAFRKHPSTGLMALRGRIIPPSAGWTPGVTIANFGAGLRPANFGRSFMCPGTGGISVMLAMETTGELRVWESSSGAVPASIDLAPISYVAEQ